VIEAEIKGEQNKNSEGDGLGHASVEIHGLVDPVTVAEIPEDAAGVAEQGCVADTEWFAGGIGKQDGGEEWDERDPSQRFAQRGYGAAGGEDEDLQQSRCEDEKPGADGDGSEQRHAWVVYSAEIASGLDVFLPTHRDETAMNGAHDFLRLDLLWLS